MTKTKIVGFDPTQVVAPLVIGITGHRDIREQDRKGLEDKLKEVFLELRRRYSSTPLILVSALAEGADRVAAQVALSLHVGVQLVVPLPMPIELYEQDFDNLTVVETPLVTVAVNRSSREEFRALLEKADTWFALKLVDGNTYEAIAEPGPERDRQYELVGKYIAQQSQILIALWDGVDSNLAGGTASVIRFQVEGVPGPEPCALELPEGFPVYHILTPRLQDPYPQGEVLKLRKIYPKAFEGNQTQAEKYYEKMFARLDEFNSYITHPNRDLAKEIVKSKSYLLQDTREDELPAGMGPALNRYAAADALAMVFQQQRLLAQGLLDALTFVAFFSLLLFVHLHEHSLPFLAFSLILLGVVVLLRKSFGKWAFDTKHLDYRAIAEGLRVKFFWTLAGITDSVADHYLGKQRTELDWIRNGFRGWNVAEGQDHRSLDSMEGDDQQERLRFVCKYWIDHQQGYFRRAAESNLKKQERIERFGWSCISGAVVLGLVLTLPCVRYNETYLGWVAIGLEALLAAAAILHHFNKGMAYAEHAKQYDRMASLFAHASDLIGAFLGRQDYEHAYLCLKKVGQEALTENGDWVLLHRERPLEVPHP